jgi:uroporphyrinogen decarboxylase
MGAPFCCLPKANEGRTPNDHTQFGEERATAMTPRDLVCAALRHEETECIPYNFMFSPPAEAVLRKHYGCQDLQAHLDSNLYLFGCAGKPLYAPPVEYGPSITDEFGVVWATSDIDRGYPFEHPLPEPTLAAYAFPDPHAPERWEPVPDAANGYPHQFRIAVIGDLWERAHFMRGLDALLMDLHEAPGFVHELLDGICDYNLATLDGMAAFGPDGVFISDDYGFQDRLMMSPADWREFVKPPLARLLAAAKQYDLVTMLHSCGNVSAIVPDLIEIGLDILHPIQPEAMDVFALKREYGADITFCGGISTQRTLPYGTPDDVRDEVNEKAEALGKGGGYILEPGITLQADVPLANLVALVEGARSYRRW